MDCSSASFLFLLAVGLGVWLRAVAKRGRVTEARLVALEVQLEDLRRSLDAVLDGAGEPRVEEVEVGEVAVEGIAVEGIAVEGVAVEGVEAPAPAATPEVEAPEPAATPEVEAPEPPEPVEPPPELAGPELAPSPSPRAVDWERWLGVRGAAVLGAAALALAGFLFLKLAIERGLVPPLVRVSLGLAAGLAALLGSEALRSRPRRYEATANALAGAGIVLLYAAVWAARALYELIPGGFAYVLMALVTGACGALSWRYGSAVIAGLGLIGGFATPILLSTGEDRPIALFGYLLLLDAGLLVLAVRRGWPLLAAVCLLATALYQGGWIFARMGAERALLGLGILGLFAAVFAASGWAAARRAGLREEGRRQGWRLASTGGVLLPFVFTFHFAGRAQLGEHLYPLAALLVLLSLLALGLGRLWRHALPAIAAAAADVAVVAVWSEDARFDGLLVWEMAACALLLALTFHLFFERGREEGAATWASLVAAAGFLLLLVVRPPELFGLAFWPWLAGWLGLAAMLWRQGARPGLEPRRLLAAVGLGAGFGLYFLAHGGPWPVLFCALATAVGLHLAALAGHAGEARNPVADPFTAAAAMPFSALVLLLGAAQESELTSGLYPAVALGLGLLVVLAATRLGSGSWTFAAMAATAAAHGLWSYGAPETAAGLAIGGLAVVLFTAWPFFAGDGLRREPWAWRGSALAAPAWFVPLAVLFEERFGDAFIGLLPVALGAVSLAATSAARRLWSAGDAAGRRPLAWFAAAALGFASVAVPLQLEKEWITLGWALQGLAVTALWRRLDHPGLKYLGLALLAAATLRLVANPALLGYYPRGGFPVFNWLLYTYLVPAAALVGTAVVLSPLEASRHRPWEARLWGGRPAGAVACGLAAIVVVFVWINLTIFDAFATGERLTVSFDRLPARDLATSLAWIAYALVLLALGMARASRGLRWISLAFLVLAIGKVFLYDLGELTDLYRVASLLGLAVSLILVSLAYQRFVFGRKDQEP